jgi:thiol:disulfide interchange protein DsbD
LLVAFVAGFLTSLMGCVYPLIPVVMAVIGTRDTRSRFGAMGLSAVYVLGMCLLYTTLGLIFAGLGRAFASWMGSPWVMSSIAGFFVLMGLSLAGVFEFRLPAGLQSRLNRVGGRGVVGAFLAGLVSGLVMAPCTGPVLSVLLVYIATTGSHFQGFFLLFFFSLGTGFLFFMVGTFAGAMRFLPRSGTWMEGVRAACAMVIMGMGLFFLRGAWRWLDEASRELPLKLFWIAALFTLTWASGALRLAFEGGWRQKGAKLSGLVLGAVGVYLTAFLVFAPSARGPAWSYDLQAGLEEARREGKPVLIDFWATWCPACLELEHKTLSHPLLAGELRRFVAIKVDCTGSFDDESLQKVMEKYDAMDLPTIRFIDSSGKLLSQPVVKGFVGPARMRELLRGIR